ncbi:PAS domain S-box protein [Halobellus sp. Atlit-31R]|nr:PAS domain S-box protein [Halobellus sp. Atlit-31R]
MIDSSAASILAVGYTSLFSAAAVTCLYGSWRARQIADRDTRTGLIAVSGLSALWAGTTAGLVFAPSRPVSMALHVVGLLVGLASVGGWLYFASAYSGREYHLRSDVRWVAVGLFGLVALLKLTNPLHQLYFSTQLTSNAMGTLLFEPEFLYWLVSGGAYTLVGVGIYWLANAAGDTRFATTRFRIVLALTAAPALLDVLVHVDHAPTELLAVSYDPLGMAVFTVGTLLVADRDFYPVPDRWHREVLAELEDATLIVDENGVVKHASPRLVERFPALADASGDSIDDHAPDLYSRITDGRDVVEWETPSGTRYYRVRTTHLSTLQSTAVDAYVFVDVTDAKQRQRELRRNRQELERFRLAVESAGHAIFLTETDGEITYVNPAFEDITGYDREEALGQTPAILSSGEMSDRFYERLWKTIGAGDVWDSEIVNRRADGQLYYAHQTIAPLTSDEGVNEAYIAIQTDISERKHRNQQLRVLGRVLRHNVRNDMNVIRGSAEVIADRGDAEASRFASRILEYSDGLVETSNKQRLVTEVLLDGDEVRQMDLSPVLDRIVADLSAEFPAAEITVSKSDPVPVEAISQIDTALAEVVRNAVVHNDAESPSVDVDVDVDTSAESVTVRVIDDGPRIPDMESQILADGTTIDDLYHGVGLGLWLVYWIVQRSSGTVAVRDNEPRGNVVEITLPGDERY